MHPNLAQGIAAERRADMRREAAANRRGRARPVPGRSRRAAHEHMAFSAATGRTGAGRTGAGRTGAGRTGAGRTGAGRTATAYRAADEMLVLPDGTTETAESTELCSAGR
jgi:hypothetical protein